MKNLFVASIKKVLPMQTLEADSTATGNTFTHNNLTEIQTLAVEEYMAVAGGPEVQNDPD
jgi:hypothetical protein